VNEYPKQTEVSRMRRLLSLLLLGVLALPGCGESTDPAGETSLSILLTDLPGDVSQAVVMIEDVLLVGGAGGPISLMTADEPWVGDLTDLENEFDQLVGGFVVPQGSYEQLRLIIPEGCIGVETEGETDETDEVYLSPGATTVDCLGTPTGTLQMPSLAETGIKVNFQGPLELLTDQMVWLVDFNVEESFGQLAGGSGTWVMSPVILGGELGFTGTVELTVDLEVGLSLPAGVTFEDFDATFDGGAPVALQTVGDVGTATFVYVIPGLSKPLGLTSDDVASFSTDPTVPVSVDVDSQEVKQVTVTITEITPITP
jgi:hypothetical protein